MIICVVLNGIYDNKTDMIQYTYVVTIPKIKTINIYIYINKFTYTMYSICTFAQWYLFKCVSLHTYVYMYLLIYNSNIAYLHRIQTIYYNATFCNIAW